MNISLRSKALLPALLAVLAGCASPPPPVPVEERSTIAVDREPAAAPASAPAPPPSLSLEAYKDRVARHILERNAERSFSGPLPRPQGLLAAPGKAMSFSETFLFDRDYRFQLRTLAGPQ